MHPIDHISTPSKYSSDPRMISGDLYQSETIEFDFLLYRNDTFLANPKSASFKLPILNLKLIFKDTFMIY